MLICNEKRSIQFDEFNTTQQKNNLLNRSTRRPIYFTAENRSDSEMELWVESSERTTSSNRAE